MPDWLQSLLEQYGYLAVFLAVLFNNIGIPLPGDTFLLGAGFLAADEMFSPRILVILGSSACFLGGTLGYAAGRMLGRKILLHSRWYTLNPERIGKVENFFKKYGARAVFFSRFVALAHPLTGLLAGMGKTPFRPFLFYNFLGSVAYALTYTWLGYFFGASWEILKGWMGRAGLISLVLLLGFALATFLLRRPAALIFNRHFKKRGFIHGKRGGN